jgi:hypothetical protein
MISKATIQINASPHPGQAKVHTSLARYKVLSAGRRWGKTRLGVFECLDVAARGGRAWWVAPTYKMTEVGWRPLRKLSAQLGAEVRKVERQVILPTGGEVTVRSADNPDTLRGEGLDFVVIDECAFMQEEVWTEALRPALSDRQGKAMFISTPAGRNWFWRLWQRGLGDDPAWQSWQLPTSDNPYIKPEEIEAARESLPELTFQQEYLATFLEGEGVVFRNILACMKATETTPDQHAGHVIIAGLDWAKQHDFTCTSIGCATCKVEVARDRFNKIDYVFQRDRLKELYKQWRVSKILAESNSIGEPNLEMLQRDGFPVIGFETTASSKPPLIENLALSFERTEWQFQADPIWTAELEAFERKVSPVTGRSQYGAPEGANSHDDTVIARALMAWQAMQVSTLQILPQSVKLFGARQRAQPPERERHRGVYGSRR